MSSKALRVLIVDDVPADAGLMVRELRQAGFEPDWRLVDTEMAYLSHLDPSLDIILADHNVPQFGARRALQLLREHGLNIPVIVVTGSFEDDALECMRLGAADYLLKDRLARLGQAVTAALQARTLLAQKRLAEEELKASEERYRSLFERVPVGLYRTTPAGQILAANPALVEMLGYPDLECLLHINVNDVYVDAKDRERQQEMIARDVTVRGFETRLRRHDGTVIWVWDTLRAVVDGDGRVLFTDGAIQDITERKLAEEQRKKLEEQLRQAQKMEAIGLLAGGIAHDFNNRLTVIQGNVQYALGKMQPSDPLYERLASVEKAALGAAEVTRKLLRFSRQEAVERKPLKLNDLISGFVSMIGRTLGSGIELRLDLACDVGTVLADANALEQVLLNLMLNSRDAMPDGGVLHIVTARTQVDGASSRRPDAKAGDFVRITVRDTGLGIEPSAMERLFEPFFTTKERSKGTGLGLPTVYGIVKQHEGWIQVESTVSKGTTFDIYLPVAQPAPVVGAIHAESLHL